METQQTDGTNEELDGLFIAMVHAVLPRLAQWIMAEGLWVDYYLRGDFEGNAYSRKMDHTKAFGGLLQAHLSDLLAMEETQLCIEKHRQAGVLPVSTHGTDEATREAVLDLIVPIAESCKQRDSWFPADLTDDSILEHYHCSRTAWGDADAHFSITFPLINFSSDMLQPQRLSTHLLLAPLTSSDKTTLWNDDAKLFSLSTPPVDALMHKY
jgi:hypothetical protein